MLRTETINGKEVGVYQLDDGIMLILGDSTYNINVYYTGTFVIYIGCSTNMLYESHEDFYLLANRTKEIFEETFNINQ